jgi:hypothetical protein
MSVLVSCESAGAAGADALGFRRYQTVAETASVGLIDHAWELIIASKVS